MHRMGSFRIDRLVEYVGPFDRPEVFFPDYEPGVAEAIRHWTGPLIDPLSGGLLMSFHSFLLRTERHTILVDACLGNDKDRATRPHGHLLRTDYLRDLVRAGVRPEQVDFVLCTHLHWDHVGWNTRLVDGRWVPTFPNARYVIARREYDHWSAVHAAGDRSVHSAAFADSVQPLMRAERAVLVDDGHAVEDGVWLEHYPGHTPGNVVINLRSGLDRGAICGDVLHSPLQLARPDWSSRACHDVAQSTVSRRRFIDTHADTGNLVLTGHFLAPSIGHIIGSADAFAFEPA